MTAEPDHPFVIVKRELLAEVASSMRDMLVYVDRYEAENFSNTALDIGTRARELIAKLQDDPRP